MGTKCKTCRYEHWNPYMEPCDSCVKCNNWEPKADDGK